MKSPVLAILVPCYNECEVFPSTERQLRSLLLQMVEKGLVAPESRVVYIDDGSRDSTWHLVEEACASHPEADAGIKLGHNVGHQYALLAGLEAVVDSCDAAVSVDADLQDDIQAIPRMVDEFLRGNEIVYGVRSSRDTDTWFKRTSAQSFYKIMNRLGVESVYNHADFRLMSSRAIRELLRYKESNIFLRGIVPKIGLSSSTVTYDRKERQAGESKYPLKKMINFGLEGITSFSIKPVRAVFMIGVVFICIALVIFIYTMIRYFTNNVIEGWTSLMLSIWFCTGVLLLALGIIGEYIGKIFLEVKERPRFVVEKKRGLITPLHRDIQERGARV